MLFPKITFHNKLDKFPYICGANCGANCICGANCGANLKPPDYYGKANLDLLF